MGAKDVSAISASKALRKEDQLYGQRLAEILPRSTPARRSMCCTIRLRQAVFSVLVEMMKEMDRLHPRYYARPKLHCWATSRQSMK
jgi:hypothetical protein